MEDNICVTGVGLVSALGLNAQENLRALLAEETGLAPIRYLETIHRDLPVGEVKKSNEELELMLEIPKETIIARTSLLGIMAAREAYAQASLQKANYERVGFISGTTVGGMDKSEQNYLEFLHNDSRNEYIGIHDCGSCTEQIASLVASFSLQSSLSTACSSAANALILGANLLKTDRLDAVVVGGAECLTKFHINGFHSLMILDKDACRPFDAQRKGINLGEGAAYLVLEKEKNALQRGAQPLALLKGYGNACDAYHQTASSPEGKGAFLSMQKALTMAKLRPQEIDYICAHGTGTGNNDLSEGNAIHALFPKMPPISSVKGFTGHTTSASASIESVLTLLAMRENCLPANLNFLHPMPELPIEPIKHTLRNHPIRYFLKNSFGFGGNNSSLIFSNY